MQRIWARKVWEAWRGPFCFEQEEAGQQEGTGGGDTDREGFRSADTDYLGRSVGTGATEAEGAAREEAGWQGRKAEEEPGFQLRRRRDADAAAKEASAQQVS